MVVADECELIEGCKRQERAAQKRMYDSFAGKMYALCLRYTKNRTDAEDVLQDAFVKIFTHIDAFRGDSPLEFWVRSVVVNTALKHLKKQKAWVEMEDSTHYEQLRSANEPVLADFQYEQLMGFVQGLPVGCQTVFNLYAIEGYQHSEIAEMLGVSEGTSKSQYARARSLLQQKLFKEKRFDDESVRKTQF
mgnify:CR=1 FL=1